MVFFVNNSAKGGQGGRNLKKHQNHKVQKRETPSEPYVLVISNVENDFAKIHQACLPSYFGLTSLTSGGKHDGQGSVGRGIGPSGSSCKWELKCRSETRSAELTITGPAEANVSSIFSHYHGHENTGGEAHYSTRISDPVEKIGERSGVKKAELKNSSSCTKNEGKEEKVGQVGTRMSSPHEHLEEVNENSVLPYEENLCASHTEAFLKKRMAFLQKKPYFGYHLRFDLNIPGREDEKTLSSTSGKKRRRQDDNSEEHQKDEDLLKAKDDSGPEKRQIHSSQTELVTAVASTSVSLPVKELQAQLKDLPGFVSCWYIYPRHSRVVFSNTATLFKAKKLLDEFEIEGNIRVHLHLSDFLTRQYEESLLAETNVPGPLEI